MIESFLLFTTSVFCQIPQVHQEGSDWLVIYKIPGKAQDVGLTVSGFVSNSQIPVLKGVKPDVISFDYELPGHSRPEWSKISLSPGQDHNSNTIFAASGPGAPSCEETCDIVKTQENGMTVITVRLGHRHHSFTGWSPLLGKRLFELNVDGKVYKNEVDLSQSNPVRVPVWNTSTDQDDIGQHLDDVTVYKKGKSIRLFSETGNDEYDYQIYYNFKNCKVQPGSKITLEFWYLSPERPLVMNFTQIETFLDGRWRFLSPKKEDPDGVEDISLRKVLLDPKWRKAKYEIEIDPRCTEVGLSFGLDSIGPSVPTDAWVQDVKVTSPYFMDMKP